MWNFILLRFKKYLETKFHFKTQMFQQWPPVIRKNIIHFPNVKNFWRIKIINIDMTEKNYTFLKWCTVFVCDHQSTNIFILLICNVSFRFPSCFDVWIKYVVYWYSNRQFNVKKLLWITYVNLRDQTNTWRIYWHQNSNVHKTIILYLYM